MLISLCLQLSILIGLLEGPNLVRQLRRGCHFDIETVKKRFRQLENHFCAGISDIVTELATVSWNLIIFNGINNILAEFTTFSRK